MEEKGEKRGFSGLLLLINTASFSQIDQKTSLGGLESSPSGDPSVTGTSSRKSASLPVGVLGILASDLCASAGEVLDIMAPRAGISSGV